MNYASALIFDAMACRTLCECHIARTPFIARSRQSVKSLFGEAPSRRQWMAASSLMVTCNNGGAAWRWRTASGGGLRSPSCKGLVDQRASSDGLLG